MWPALNWFDTSVNIALYRYGTERSWFKSYSSLNFFFQALILSLFNCGDQLFLPILFFFRSFNIWYFIYSFAKQNIPVQFYLNVPILLFVKPMYSKEKQPSTLKALNKVLFTIASQVSQKQKCFQFP